MLESPKGINNGEPFLSGDRESKRQASFCNAVLGKNVDKNGFFF